MKRKSVFVKIGISLMILSAIILSVCVGVYLYIRSSVNFSLDNELFKNARHSNITTFYYNASEDGVSYIPKELSRISADSLKKEWYSYEKIGNYLKDGFISVEDRSFKTHRGVDFKRTFLAFINYFTKKQPTFGASTITQQVIKNISGDNERSAKRKIAEIIRAMQIEYAYTKEEIMEVYLNIVPMGQGILGVGLASEYYFSKEPGELTSAEAATLIGITNAPTKYNPYTNYGECKKKRNNVLRIMCETGVISEEEYLEGIKSELSVNPQETSESKIESWFVECVCEDVIADYAKMKGINTSLARKIILTGGYSVYTTVNPKIQKILEEYFENSENFPEKIGEGLNFSMVVCDSKNGDLLGIVGSVGKKTGNRLLNYAEVPHQPGSTLKPIALYAPLINSGKVNWATVFDDVPITFTKSGDEYILYPQNSPRRYDGLTPLSDALRLSKNTVAVRLYNMLGARKIFDSLKRDFGFSSIVESAILQDGRKITDLAPSPLALGQLSYGVSLRTLTEAYTVFSGYGEKQNPRSYTALYDKDGVLVIDNTEKEVKRVFSSECAKIMNMLLMGVTESGTASSLTLPEIIDTAGKTGTSGNDRDRLFVGYTPYFTAGIWCGYTGGEKSIGALEKTHLKVWDEIMIKIHNLELSRVENPRTFSSDGLLYLPYCKDSGEIYTERCTHDPRGERMSFGYFTNENRPIAECHRHLICRYDVIGEGIAIGECPEEYTVDISLIEVSERKFPCEVYVTDAEYVYREYNGEKGYPKSTDLPYFACALDEGEYVGISKKKKQFNSISSIHIE